MCQVAHILGVPWRIFIPFLQASLGPPHALSLERSLPVGGCTTRREEGQMDRFEDEPRREAIKGSRAKKKKKCREEA